MNAERLLQHYEQIADAPDAIARLRRFILDLAVRGKLVPQDPKDEPAAALLKRFEFDQAVTSANGREQESNPTLTSNEVPFDIPEKWLWVKLGKLASKITDGEHLSPNKTTSGMPLLTAVHVASRGLVFDNPQFVSVDDGVRFRRRCDPMRGDILICSRGTIGRCVVVDVDEIFCLMGSVILIRLPADCSPAYFKYFLSTDSAQERMRGMSGATAVKALYLKDIRHCPMPIPPLAEQHRIVAKVDELMALCDELEAARTERETKRDRLAAASLARLNTPGPETFRDDARFALNALPALTARPDQIKQLRQTILNLAVRGKLVPQDPVDEPAEELLKRIAAERDELVRQKVIRRDAPLEPLTAQDCPHPIPSSWTWSRVGDAVLFTQYGTSQKSHASQSGVPVLAMGNIQDGRVIWRNEKRIPEASDELPALYLQTFDLLYNRTNSAELVGKTGIYLGQNDALTFASYLIRLRPSMLHSSPVFLNVAMNAPCFRETQIVPLIKKQTGQANVSGSALKNMLIPLPPLAEQLRIVAKLDELLALCDQLEKSLTSADETRKRLLDALLAEALAPVEAETMQEAAE
jgi:type I restriction enzyme S subunit